MQVYILVFLGVNQSSVIHGLVAKFNHQRVKVYHLHKLSCQFTHSSDYKKTFQRKKQKRTQFRYTQRGAFLIACKHRIDSFFSNKYVMNGKQCTPSIVLHTSIAIYPFQISYFACFKGSYIKMLEKRLQFIDDIALDFLSL